MGAVRSFDTRSGFSTRPLRQCLPDIGLRNSKLPCDCGWLDARFEGGTHRIQLVVNEPARSPAASWRRCVFASATGFSFAEPGGRRPRRSVVTAAQAAHRFPHHPTASVPRPGPPARDGAAARPGCPVRLCPWEQPEPRKGLVLSPQAAELAYPNYAAVGSPRQQLARANHHIVLAADPLFAAPPRPRTRTKTRMPRRG